MRDADKIILRREHSRKPDEIYSYINRMYPQHKKLELFARNKSDGWDVFGDQVEGSIKL